jgi:BolA family transcriptional regulator, general stress-responsive regulator
MVRRRPPRIVCLEIEAENMSVAATDIETQLRAALQPETLEVQDDSHLHAGHAGAREGRHFTVRVTSERFSGLSRLARHRLIYDALRQLIPRGIHALAIEARAPGEP